MPLSTWILWCRLWWYVLFYTRKEISIAGRHSSIFALLCIGRIVNECHIFSHQIWMFVTLVHVKILELATILELGGLCACVLQISEESHVQVRAWDGKVNIIEYPWITYGVFLLVTEYNFAVLTLNQLGLIKGYWYSVSFVSSLCACPTEFLEEEKKKKMFSLISLFVYC